MIVRVWQAVAAPTGADQYRTHFTDSVLPELRSIAGFRGAMLLEQRRDDLVHIKVMTRWESIDKVRTFAGESIDAAVVEPAAKAALSKYDDTVVHYAVVVDDEWK
jgi:heme-degrading monooxygenase HmoA